MPELNEIGVDIEMSGTIFGAKVGYNFQNNNLVYGVEADISNGPTGLTPQGTFGPVWGCGSGDCYADIDLLASVRARAGYLASPNLMIFGTAGLGYAQVTGGIVGSSQDGGGSATGLVYGGGAEFMLGANSTIGAEYLMYDINPIPFGDDGIGNVFDALGGFSVIRAFYSRRF